MGLPSGQDFSLVEKLHPAWREGQMEKDLISREDKERLLLKVQRHLSDEAEVDLGRFEVEALVDLVARLIGPHYYNKGLRDAQALLARQVDQINDAFYEMERLPEA
ncbi:DUF2164 domain-containing protein [Rhizobium rosettiformans W3]|uniref:DUF2164 domain-containing protein n=2 Tax=Rhizobium rosettiformans TaxID=1368430 RepID=A0A4S8PLN7_9HYPH|nr:DUF2164 domain-containing protein [Rhizobium rosettiformans W3]